MGKKVNWETYWKKVADDLEKKHPDDGHPSNWSKDRIITFIIGFDRAVESRVKNEPHLRKILGLQNENLPKTEDGSIISTDTIKRLFKKKSSQGYPYTRNLFAIYLGHDSAHHYYKDRIEKNVNEDKTSFLQGINAQNAENQSLERLKIELEKWKEEVTENPKWTPVQLILNNHLPSKNLYQPIYLSALNKQEKLMTNMAGEMREFQLAQNIYQKSLAAISIYSLLNDLFEWTILIGVPGSGKTSSMKWLIQQIYSETVSDYDHSIYISLSDLEDYLQNFPRSNFYSYFFYTHLKHDIDNAENLGDLLKNQLENLGNILFLFDGLDEVNPKRRHYIINHISKLLHRKQVVITSRPSAVSVLFSLRGTNSYYDIIPLSPPSIRNLVTKYSLLGSSSLSADEILKRISDSIALQKLAVTPFVLIVICEIISHPNFSENVQLNQAEIFSMLVRFIKQDHNERIKYPLKENHIELLKEFADKLSFNSKGKAIKGMLPEGTYNKKAIIQSRFLNEIGLNLGTFEFIHLRLQEYFTALSIYGKSTRFIERFVEEKAMDVEWLEVTCFLIGHSYNLGLDEEVNSSLKKHLNWVKHELTGNGWYRLAKIQSTKGNSLRDNSLGVNLYDVIFEFILDSHPLFPKFVELLIETDGIYFLKNIVECIKITENPNMGFILKLLYLTPLPLQEASGMIQFTKNIPHYMLNAPLGLGFLKEEELSNRRLILKDWKNQEQDVVKEAIETLSSSGDYQCIDLLAHLINHSNPFTKEAAKGLSRIGGIEAACALAEALTSTEFTSYEELETVSWSLMLRYGGVLEPKSKGILFNWLLALEQPYPKNTQYVVHTLDGVKLNNSVIEKLIDILLSTEPSMRNIRNRILARISEIKDEKIIEKLLSHNSSEHQSLLKDIETSIAFIPSKRVDLINRYKNYLTENIDFERRDYLKVLVRSWSKYPTKDVLSFVPKLLEDEFLLSENNNDYSYRTALWKMLIGHDMTNYFSNLAWADLISESSSVTFKKTILNYLEESNFRPNKNQIEELKNQLIEDQKQLSLKEYVKDALSYIISSKDYVAKHILSYVKQYFDHEHQQYYTFSIIQEAALSGYLILGEKTKD